MADINLLRKIGRSELVPENNVVFFQGDVGTSIYFVLKGTFGVYINNFSGFPTRVAEIKQGSVFGEVAAIDEGLRSATVVSEEDGAVLIIEKENFGELLVYAPDICEKIIATLRRRIESTSDILRQAGKNVPMRSSYTQIKQLKNAENNINLMKLMTQDLRKLNDRLTALNDSAGQSPLPKIMSNEAIKLLPDEYTSLKLYDDFKDNSRMLFRQDYCCPYCTDDLQTFIPLISVLKPESAALDGRTLYKGFDILRYTNIICPHCNYADSYQEFGRSGPKRIQGEHKGSEGSPFSNIESFTGYADAYYHTIDETVMSYYLNIHCLNLTAADPLRLANAWIRLYWIFGDCKKSELAKQAAGNARRYYDQYLAENGKIMFIEDKMRLQAILGELNAALGEYDKARAFYEQNIEIGKGMKTDLIREYKDRHKELKRR